MARLEVLGDFQGPGERKTAEQLAADLPADWLVVAGRKLPTRARDDLDLIVVGQRRIWVLEEKSWGPRVELGDVTWRVKGEDRRNPVDRVAHLARVLAGTLRDRVPGYPTVSDRETVSGAVVMSNDRLELVTAAYLDLTSVVLPLADAAPRLLAEDRDGRRAFGATKAKIEAFLLGLEQRDPLPPMLGTYPVKRRLAPLGFAEQLESEAMGRPVILRCYPVHGWGPGFDPRPVINREGRALLRLEDRDRAWRTYPQFFDEPRQWVVVPVAPSQGRRNLFTSVEANDPERADGRLPDNVAYDVARDAFMALSEVHDEGLLHRGLHPRRVWLGRQMRVKFSDFFMARVEGEGSVGVLFDGTNDISSDYRPPELGESLSLATRASDVFSLAHCVLRWLTGDFDQSTPLVDLLARLDSGSSLRSVLHAALDPAPSQRPSAAEAAAGLVTPVPLSVPEPDPFRAEWRVDAKIDGRYRIKRQLGVGGYATSWLAWDERTEDQRVLKQFHDLGVAQVALAEFEALQRVSHPKCARVWDRDGGVEPEFLVLEYVDGENLSEYAANALPDWRGFRQVALDVLDGLGFLHENGLVHRDVSPGNIIVTADGRAKLIDFGLAGVANDPIVAGTPAYMAPEVRARQGATAQSDLYSLAVSLLRIMLGRYPYAGDPIVASDVRDRLTEPTSEEREQWGDAGSAMLDLLFVAASAAPTGRPQSARAFADELSAINEIPTAGGEARVNPTVLSLRRLYKGSSAGNGGNRGLDDQFAKDTYVSTRLDDRLLPVVLAGEVDVVILTGNPGDGKTSFLVKVGDALRSAGAAVVSETAGGWVLDGGDRRYAAVYDASESQGGKSSDEVLHEAFLGHGAKSTTVLVAINDGRLLSFFADNEDLYPDVAPDVMSQLRGEAPRSERVLVVDLKRRTLAPTGSEPSLGRRVLQSFVAPERWDVCDGCCSRHVCPLVLNATTLRTVGADAIDELLLVSHLRRKRRATFRDVRSALAWAITGDRSCDDVHRARDEGQDLRELPDSLSADLLFSPVADDYLISEWRTLDPLLVAAPSVERVQRSSDLVTSGPLGSDRAPDARQLFVGTWSGNDVDRTHVRTYRYLEMFVEFLDLPTEDGLHRVLLGLSKITGAPAYDGTGLALAVSGAGGAWAVLKELDGAEFQLDVRGAEHDFVEGRSEALMLHHPSGGRLAITLDTAELILRAADGELLGDAGAAGVRQEIASFAGRLHRQPADRLRIIDAAGHAHSVRRSDAVIEVAS